MKSLDREQLWLVLGSFLFLLVLYFGCDTKSPEVVDGEKSRSQNIETTSIQNLLTEARASLRKEDFAAVSLLSEELNAAEDTLKEEKFRQLSSYWYELGYPAISAFYAEELAKKVQSEESWSVSGTTYAICVQNTEDEKVKAYCAGRAIKSFESAVSLNPDNVNHRINIALVNVDYPPNGQPMTGILQLRELNEKYPENTAVMNQLARLAIRTNQIDRAIERLTVALKLEPDNKTSNCLMADALIKKGAGQEAEQYKLKCQG